MGHAPLPLPESKEHNSESAPSMDTWPRVSPEVSVKPVHWAQQGSLDVPQAWRHVNRDYSKLASRAELREWLGPQAWKIGKGVKVGLVEIYAGLGNLSQVFEDAQAFDANHVQAIRLGHRWGQELRSAESRWFVQSLLALCKPRDVWVAFPCKAHCKWNQFNVERDLATRQKVLQERLRSKDDLKLLFEVIEAQCLAKRGVHAENPRDSLAWRDSRFKRLKWAHGFVTFEQCSLGLKHPRTGKPLQKSTTVFTTNRSLAKHLSQFRCCHQAIGLRSVLVYIVFSPF